MACGRLNSSSSCRVKPCPHPPSTHPTLTEGLRTESHPMPPATICSHSATLPVRCATNMRWPPSLHTVVCSVESIVMIKSPSASGNLEGGSRRQSARTRKVTGRLLAAPACLLSMPPTPALAETLPRGQPPPRPHSSEAS